MIEEAEPEIPSVPDQLYVYTPVPPDAVAVQVADCPAVVLVGETEHEAVRVGVTVTVAVAEEAPAAFVQVRVYVVDDPGETETVPDVGSERAGAPLSMEAEVAELVHE